MKGTEPEGLLVLYADDDPDDRLLLADAWKASATPHLLRTVGSGEEVLAAVTNHLETAAEQPLAVLVDLKMPGVGGDEVLRRLKAQPQTRHIPVSVISSSEDPNDLRRIYASGGASYLVKPAEFETLIAKVRCFASYWGDTAFLARGRS